LENEIIIEDVSAGYGSVRVLHNVSVRLTEGETIVLLGTNGNGKTTLMKCIMGVVRPTSGKIVYKRDGKHLNIDRKKPEEIVRMGISLIPEGRRLFPQMTVKENLHMGSFRQAAREHFHENLALCFKNFEVLDKRKDQLAGTLSGGEQQMLALARAIMSNPKFLLIDEPSVGLAPIAVKTILAKIREMQKQRGLGILMTEQNFLQAVKIADRGSIMVQGQIVFNGGADELGQHKLVKRFYLGG
jgi:branched-chain amino acid transport system ATP-binding protein